MLERLRMLEIQQRAEILNWTEYDSEGSNLDEIARDSQNGEDILVAQVEMFYD